MVKLRTRVSKAVTIFLPGSRGKSFPGEIEHLAVFLRIQHFRTEDARLDDVHADAGSV